MTYGYGSCVTLKGNKTCIKVGLHMITYTSHVLLPLDMYFIIGCKRDTMSQ